MFVHDTDGTETLCPVLSTSFVTDVSAPDPEMFHLTVFCMQADLILGVVNSAYA